MRLTFSGLSDVGCHRTTNQDSYYLSPTGHLFVVADGMGGHVGGQEASRLATEAIQCYIEAHWQSDRTSPDILEQAILGANEAVLADQRQHPERAEMGTTVVIVMIREGQFWCAHVGDSRLYRLNGSRFVQLTQDHTWVAQAMEVGELTPEELQQHPWRHVLSQCIGRKDLQKIEIQRVQTEPGDWLLLCSDGLTEDLSDDAIMTYLQAALTCEDTVATLVEAAKVQGGRDNITVVALNLSA